MKWRAKLALKKFPLASLGLTFSVRTKKKDINLYRAERLRLDVKLD